MNIHPKFFSIPGCLVCIGAAFAGPTGKHESLLLQTLMANANGECPSSIMADSLWQSCDSQIADVRDKLSKLGKITQVSYLGTEATQTGEAERYSVLFEHGEWSWALNTQSDGRLQFANAPNPPHYDIGSYRVGKN